MARPGVTYSQVAESAAALVHQGWPPTVDGVRAQLGTGSKSTIGPLLKQWKAQQAEWVNKVETGLPTELAAVVKGLYKSLQQQAQDQINVVKEKTHAQVKSARQVQQAAEARQRQLNGILEIREAACAQLKAEKATLKTALEDSQQTQLVVQTEAEGLRQRLEDRTQAAQDLKHQMAQAQANLEHYRESVRQQREQERADFAAQNQQLAHALKKVQEKNRTIQAAYGHLEKGQARLQAEKNQLLAENASLDEQMGQLNQNWANIQQQRAEEKGRHHALVQAHQEMIVKLEAREEAFLGAEKKNATVQERVVVLSAALQKIEVKMEELQIKNQALTQEKAAIEGQFKQWQSSL